MDVSVLLTRYKISYIVIVVVIDFITSCVVDVGAIEFTYQYSGEWSV